MNCLPMEKRTKIIELLLRGLSLRATAEATGTSTQTVMKLLRRVGYGCIDWHDQIVRNVPARKVQVDEMWQYCYAKDKTLLLGRAKCPPPEAGTFWTWIALEQHTKLVISWLLSPYREYEPTEEFMYDLRSRLKGKIELSSDGYSAYRTAVERVFGDSVDYGQVKKQYDGRGRYNTSKRVRIIGNPEHITSSNVERMNQTLRKDNRRYTRRGTTGSKKMGNHIFHLAIQLVHYNFCRPHMSLGDFTTPAMVSGIVDELYDYEWLVRLGDGTVDYPEVEIIPWEPTPREPETPVMETSGGTHRPRTLRRLDLGK